MPPIVAVAGISSNVGKTTLVCRLLGLLPGWEAIKITKGHYRSCGKDPHACCVSHLLGVRPIVRSGREDTYAKGKDTGQYWDAGASNVHWVIATKGGVEEGLREALARVAPGAPGVLVEGTGFLKNFPVARSIMVVGDAPREIKASAASVFGLVDYAYLSRAATGDRSSLEAALELACAARRGAPAPAPPALFESDLPRFAREVELAPLATPIAG